MTQHTGRRVYAEIPYVEDLEGYRLGGFHPVHIGDYLRGGRYHIVNKIGFGCFSTVWLAEDTMTEEYVAVSIAQAHHSQSDGGSREIKILQHLASRDAVDHPGRSNVLLPLETFHLVGPNGSHSCIVTPLQGQSLSMVMKRKLGRLSEILPLSKAKRAVLSIIKGLSFIHSKGISHGDLHPGNLLLSLSDSEKWSVERMSLICGAPRTVPIRRLDGLSLDQSVPQYGVEAALSRFSDMSLYSGVMKVSDFGCGYFAEDPPSDIDFFGPYIVPEQYCTGFIGLPSDVWTLGCAIFLLLSGRDLFGTVDDSTGKVFSIMTQTLGEPPEYILQSWRRRALGEDLQISKKPSSPVALRIQEMRAGNEEHGMNSRRDEFSNDDIALLTNLLSSIFQYNPKERPTMETVLQHPAMAVFQGGDGSEDIAEQLTRDIFVEGEKEKIFCGGITNYSVSSMAL